MTPMSDETWAQITAHILNEPEKKQPAPREEPPVAGEASAQAEIVPLRGRPFAKGTSGNPAGRAPGARNKATQVARALFDENAKALTERAIALALEGNLYALKLCLERVLPRQRDAVVALDLPSVATAAECTDAIAAVVAAAAEGELTPREARAMAATIDDQRAATALIEFEKRLTLVEARAARIQQR